MPKETSPPYAQTPLAHREAIQANRIEMTHAKHTTSLPTPQCTQ